MLLSIGRRPTPSTLTEMLLECHGRIRHFASLAVRLAHDRGASPEQRAEVAASIVGYFGRALPLHIADEEESLLPRLSGGERLTAPLDRMRREHRAHEPLLDELLTLMRGIAEDGHRLAESAPRLRELAAALESELLAHVAHEEAVILPQIAILLDGQEQRAVIAEMRARRA